MNLQTFFTLYVISLPIFFVIDLIWLGLLAKDFYRSRLVHVMGDINWTAAIIFYLIFLLGLTFFALYPTETRGTLYTGIILGGLFGFFTYATYDLTNLATIRNWPLSVVIVDIVWGTILGASVTALTYLIHTHFFAT